jgi:PilZ domain-containing protein
MSSETFTGTRAVSRFSGLQDLSVTYEGGNEEIALRPPDVSTRGMFINTVQSLPIGSVLTIRFRLAHSGIEVNTRGEVRYCLPGVGVGVEFVEISPEAVQAIESQIEAMALPANKK